MFRAVPARFAEMRTFWDTFGRHFDRRLAFLRATCPPVVMAALAVVGCTASVDPIAVDHDCPDQPFRGPALYASEPSDRLISDFEDGTTKLAEVANRNGSWIHGRDLTSVSVTIGPSNECAARGEWAGHLAASTPTSWGNNWSAFFRGPGLSAPYDGRDYGGISFWAAFGGKNGPSFAVPLAIVTAETTSPSCTDHCGDDYVTSLTLTREWRRYELRFDDLKQEREPQSPLRRDQLVAFTIMTQQQCDIWIDDVRLEP
jgi:hypothetical protein